MRRIALAVLLTSAALSTSPAFAEVPAVVASIKPVHSLLSAVMQGVGEPLLLVRGAASPHTYALKPSDARALSNADLVFWVGPELEGFLEKPLKANAKKARSIALMEVPDMVLLDAREGGAWETHDHETHDHGDHEDHGDHGHDHKDEHAHNHDHDHGHDHGEVNTHIWLNPANAKRIIATAAEALSAKDPANATTYRTNADRASQRIDVLDAELKAKLAPVVSKPFVVFHDAYHYYEAHYGLNGVGAITVNPERRPSAKRLSEIRAKITELGAVCVFAEPQFEPALVDTIIEGTKARKGVLDPEGADIPDGPDLYPTLMADIAAALTGCFGS